MPTPRRGRTARTAALALICAALVLALPAAAGAQSDDGASAPKEQGADDTTAGFTPPLFGAPQKRIGAGSRELGDAKCPDGQQDTTASTSTGAATGCAEGAETK